MGKIRIKQLKSKIDRPYRQKRTLEALGLKKINHVVEHDENPQIIGMVNSIKHLIEIEKVN